jgi:mannose-6-phosphate isomerase-like protein (cupin superfamily)
MIETYPLEQAAEGVRPDHEREGTVPGGFDDVRKSATGSCMTSRSLMTLQVVAAPPQELGRRTLSLLFAGIVAGSVSLLVAPNIMAQTAADPTSLHWQVPDVLPPGALIAVVKGDPTGPGESTLQLSMPNDYRIPPHFHPGFEHVEVREGTLLVGMGDRLDPKRTRPLAMGDSATAPAGMHHFSIAKGRTELSVTFMGPYTITYIHAEDAPRPRVFPFSY